jgi:hypothetical protein
MNTETRKHTEEKPPYERKTKYREELIDDEALQDLVGDEEDGGVLADFPEEPEDVEEERPVKERAKRGKKT